VGPQWAYFIRTYMIIASYTWLCLITLLYQLSVFMLTKGKQPIRHKLTTFFIAEALFFGTLYAAYVIR
jgi:hypothetical protein